jgi:ElaA protein
MEDAKLVGRTFEELDPRTLYALLQLRQSILVVEQKSPYTDLDGRDVEARHLRAVDQSGMVLGYARLFGPRYRDDLDEEITTFGRLVVIPERRKRGLGRAIMKECLKVLDKEFPNHDIRISAQHYLEPFYKALGFNRDSDPYDDAGVTHIDMRRKRK